ncbi:MAG: hypothetical protein LBJ84_03090, partial [Oscillospiraceae bacterium]|nr:hypothetical protein [Oscillospiraceae bacterium]
MTKLKKRVFTAAVALFILLLLATVLSRSVYNLMLPQVTAVPPQRGALINPVTYSLHSVVGREFEDGEAADGYMYSAAINMTYDELYVFRQTANRRARVNTFDAEEPSVSVSLAIVDYAYDAALGIFVTELSLTSSEPLEPGLPFTVDIVDNRVTESGELLIPMGGVYQGDGGYYVWLVKDAKTLWGATKTVERVDVEYFGSNYAYASVTFASDRQTVVACNPTKPLYD